MRVFLDSCLLARLSTRGIMGPLVSVAVPADIRFVTSTYAMHEALALVQEPGWPPKAMLAFIMNTANLIMLDRLHVRLEEVTPEELQAAVDLCDDFEDVPIILAAAAENCDYLLTTDRGVLRSRSPVPCIRPETLTAELQEAVKAVAANIQAAETAAAGDTPAPNQDVAGDAPRSPEPPAP